MGNCLEKKQVPEPAKELKSGVKGTVAFLTFAGPQSCFESFKQEESIPPTFSDPVFFNSDKGSATMNDLGED